MMEYKANVEGMSCSGCANAVKTAFSQVEGVESVTVDLESKQASIHSEEKLTKERLDEALSDTNYTVESLN